MKNNVFFAKTIVILTVRWKWQMFGLFSSWRVPKSEWAVGFMVQNVGYSRRFSNEIHEATDTWWIEDNVGRKIPACVWIYNHLFCDREPCKGARSEFVSFRAFKNPHEVQCTAVVISVRLDKSLILDLSIYLCTPRLVLIKKVSCRNSRLKFFRWTTCIAL